MAISDNLAAPSAHPPAWLIRPAIAATAAAVVLVALCGISNLSLFYLARQDLWLLGLGMLLLQFCLWSSGRTSDLSVLSAGHPLLVGAKFENTPDGDGVILVGLAPNSRAAYSGLRPGDRIYAANRQRVNNIQDLVAAVQRNRREILLQIQRGGNAFYLVLR